MRLKCIKNTITEKNGLIVKKEETKTFPFTIGSTYEVQFNDDGYGHSASLLIYTDQKKMDFF